jgi:hypothetical protein
LTSNKYSTVEEFEQDLDLIWANCLQYNAEESIIAREAIAMRRISLGLVKKFKIREAQQ